LVSPIFGLRMSLRREKAFRVARRVQDGYDERSRRVLAVRRLGNASPTRPGKRPKRGGQGFRGAPGALEAESPGLQKALLAVIS
jgi:hypothetical protein